AASAGRGHAAGVATGFWPPQGIALPARRVPRTIVKSRRFLGILLDGPRLLSLPLFNPGRAPTARHPDSRGRFLPGPSPRPAPHERGGATTSWRRREDTLRATGEPMSAEPVINRALREYCTSDDVSREWDDAEAARHLHEWAVRFNE